MKSDFTVSSAWEFANNADLRRMIPERRALLAAELNVVGCDLDILLAQILGQNSADLAVADQSYLPSPGITGHQFSPRGFVEQFVDFEAPWDQRLLECVVDDQLQRLPVRLDPERHQVG
jgi:hypothetical protein